jgi:hypothetical protein
MVRYRRFMKSAIRVGLVNVLCCFNVQAASTPPRTREADVYVSPGIYSAQEPKTVAVIVAVDWPKPVELIAPSGTAQTSAAQFRVKRTGKSGNQQRFEVSVATAMWAKKFLEEHEFSVTAEGAQVATFRLSIAMEDRTLYLAKGKASLLGKQVESIRKKAAQKK